MPVHDTEHTVEIIEAIADGCLGETAISSLTEDHRIFVESNMNRNGGEWPKLPEEYL